MTHEFRRDGEGLHVATRSGPRVMLAVVEYAFGSWDHLTTFVGRDEQARSVMLRISAHQKEQQTIWSVSTGLPARPHNDDEYLGDVLVKGDGARRCVNCHTTSPHATLNRTGPEAADRSIGCERCHGPGGHHELAVDAGFVDTAIAATGRSSPSEINAICAVSWPAANGDRSFVPDISHALPFSITRDELEPLLHREWRDAELRDLPQPSRERRDVGQQERGEVPRMSLRHRSSTGAPGGSIVGNGHFGDSPPFRPATGGPEGDDRLLRESVRGLPRLPYAAGLGQGDILLQDGSFHPRSSTRSSVTK